MGPLAAFVVIAIVSLAVVRVGTVALVMTGLSRDSASFQSLSAFFGVGFTTHEAENVVNHPVRRRIIRHLIVSGNIGITSALATLAATVVQQEAVSRVAMAFGWIILIVGSALVFGKIGIVQRAMEHLIRLSLEKSGVLHALDYELLLKVESGFCISEVEISKGSPVAGKTLAESRPADYGVVILGITNPAGVYHGTPGPRDRVEAGDTLTVYCREESVHKLTGKKPEAPEGPEPSGKAGQS